MALEMRNRAFWLDGVPHFMYGGELHYFRLPAARWAEQLQRLQALGISIVSTYVPWLWHESRSQEFDFMGQTHPQRNLQLFLSMAGDAGLKVFIRPGPYVMAELRQEGIPSWLLAEYPEVVARGSDGGPHPTGAVSYLHPTFLSLVDRWYAQLASAIRPYFVESGGPIVMTQVDNEIGMLHWVSGSRDTHPLVLAAYREFCQTTQEDPEAYWTRGRFWRQYRAEYVAHLIRQAELHGFPGPYVVNVHGFRDFSFYSRGVDYPIGLSQLSGVPTSSSMVLGGDFYPGHVTYDNFHDLALATLYTRAVNAVDAATFSPEFQSGRFQDRPHVNPSDLELSARVSIAHGLNGINWYMLSSGENPDDIGVFGRDHGWQAPVGLDGEYRASATVVKHLGMLMRDFGESLVQTAVEPDIHMGFYSMYYMTEDAETASHADIIEHIVYQRENMHFDGVYRLLVAANLQVQAIWVDAPDNRLDPTGCPILWMATTRYMDRQSQERLADYVLSGGTLVIGPEIPTEDLNGGVCRVLLDALDLTQATTTGYRGVASIGSWDSVYCPTYATFGEHPKQRVLGRLVHNHEVVAFDKPCGLGRVVVMGVGWSALYDSYHAVIRELVATIRERPPVLTSENAWVHVVARQGVKGNFLFAHNLHETESETVVTLSLTETDVVEWPISLKPRQGLMLPYGGVAIAGTPFLVEFTTAEISRGAENTLWIHRSPRSGYATLRKVGPEPSELRMIRGSGILSTHDNLVTVRWEHDHEAIPIHLKVFN